MFIAAAAVMAASCGNTSDKKAEQTAPAEIVPSVAVEQVFVQDVPQEATYTSTVQAYVKNNIVPQTAGRIVKINVEIGDRVRKGQVLAEIDKAQLQQAQLQLSNAEVELERLKALYEAGGLSKSDLDAIELQYNVAKTQVQNLIENLIWTLTSNTFGKRNINQTTMGLLFMQLLNHTDKLSHESREDKAIMDIFRYIEENYRDGSLTDAARLLHYDFYWLSHEIKNRTGKTYTEHLQEKRLSQAAFLLKNTNLSVEEITIAVGYENKSYFHRIFTERFGTTPRKYRNG